VENDIGKTLTNKTLDTKNVISKIVFASESERNELRVDQQGKSVREALYDISYNIFRLL